MSLKSWRDSEARGQHGPSGGEKEKKILVSLSCKHYQKLSPERNWYSSHRIREMERILELGTNARLPILSPENKGTSIHVARLQTSIAFIVSKLC